MKRLRKDVAHVMDAAISRGETPCALALLWRHDGEKLYHASGYADLGRNVPVARDTLFRLFSLTKPITAVTAMTLVERGELDLYAPVGEYLESYKNQQVAVADNRCAPVTRPMLVADLFSMTSGLCYPGDATPAERAMSRLFEAFAAEEQAGNQPDTLSVASRIGRQPLAFQPGDGWLYGASADVLGALVQVVSGKALDAYMAETVLEPLGMTDTGFFVPAEKKDRLATLYEHRDGMLSPFTDNFLGLNDFLSRPNFISGGAGLVSTLDDVLRFARMLLGEGQLCGERVLSRRSVQWLSQNHLSPRQADTLNRDSMAGYGYGGLMRVLAEPAHSFSLGVAGEYGWDGWSGVYMTVCPEEDLILLLMQQRTESGVTPLTRKVRNIVYSQLG
ncbi:MAG: serine hydrolase domain-containing protein [Candidatus Limiplasma sp.]|nr:serine hydrolase domain-containing protein [Candidatus Limiplasma sp.]